MVDSIIISIPYVGINQTNESIYKFVINNGDKEQFSYSEGTTKRIHNYKNRMSNIEKKLIVGKTFYNSSNAFTWRYFEWKSTVELNFSIPKLLFGSNVFEWFGKEINTRHNYIDNIDQNYIYQLYEVIAKALDKISITKLNNNQLKTLVIKRIDVCRNMIFDTKEIRNSYFDHLKQVRKKYSYSIAPTSHFRDNSVMWVTQNYSAKIYKKDVEFINNDLKEFASKNSIKYTSDILNVSERILRFELTIRNAQLSYLQRSKIDIYSIEPKKEQIQLSCIFNLFGNEFFEIVSPFDFGYKNRLFGLTLLKECYIMLENFIQNFNFSSIPDDTSFLKALDKFVVDQESKGKRVHQKRYKSYYKLLKESTLDELIDQEIIVQRSKSNVIKMFKNIGFDVNNMVNKFYNVDYSPNTYFKLFITKFGRSSLFK